MYFITLSIVINIHSQAFNFLFLCFFSPVIIHFYFFTISTGVKLVLVHLSY